MLFIGLVIVIFSTVFYFRNKLTTNTRRIQQKKKELSPMISEFIFYSNDAPKEEKHIYIKHKILIRELLKNDFDRKVLISILLDLKKDVSGETQKQLIHLYKNLGLHEDAYKKLKSWRWEVVAKGIMELTQMQVTESYQMIVGFINNKRSVIRKQAEIATVTLKNEGVSYFMDTTKYRISEWQQLVLLEVLRNNKDFEPPRFKAWLTSKNKHVVLLALRLIKHFNQNDAKDSLIELVKHRNNQIKEEAIYCLREFHVVEALDTLKLVFWRCSTDIKILILGAIAELGDTGDIEFLKRIEYKRLHFSVKSKALNAINSIAPESIMPTKGIESTDNIIVPEDLIKETMKREVIEEKSNENTSQESKEVSHEEIESVPFEVDSPTMEEVIEENPELDNLEVDELLGFLPIVVPADAISEETEIDVNEFDVIYKELNSPKKPEEQEIVGDINHFAPDLIDDDLNFLPIVVDSDVENVLNKKEKLSQETLWEFDLEYEEIVVLQEKMVIEEILENNQDKAEKHLHEISSSEVIHEELIVEEKVKEEEEKFIKWTDSEENIPGDELKKEELEAILSIIPKPYEFDDETSELICLLSNIEEFGDHREIPFLTHLLLEESRPLISERIRDVIYGIEKAIDSIDENVRPGVFEQLFNRADLESKLILMDEIIAIGDEKEVHFLAQLVNDDNVDISTKAESALAALKEQLSNENRKERDTGSFDLLNSYACSLDQKAEYEDLLTFTDEFVLEPLTNTGINQDSKIFSDKNMNSTFLSQLISIPNKLLEKLNG